MNITVITPPLVQLNSPYPSGAYLTSFFKNLGHDCRWKDLSIALVYELFSKEGLSRMMKKFAAELKKSFLPCSESQLSL